ncbi:MAG: hypothetical protein M3Q58_15565 [Bacteroidota bacterium]|nr:hypothetical protein [Bacteroidota bacterium]
MENWNADFGLPKNSGYEASFDSWYRTTDSYKKDQAHKASGLMLGGHIMAAQLTVFALGGAMKPSLPSPSNFTFNPRYNLDRSSLLKELHFPRAPGYYARPNHKLWPKTTYKDVIMRGRLNWNSANGTWRISSEGLFNANKAQFQLGIRPDGGVIHNFIKPM